ncbi:MAG: Gfo/Idh/MocA family oxidoreductase [Anaerolineae bacterium]|nr:Gfo/Idh/MocA family oxidoreductase [Anaerolineae bacterium]
MEALDKVKVGLVGCGAISGIYLKHAPRFGNIEIVACADLVRERAQERADEYGIPKVCMLDALLADPEIEIVLNLTTPQAHADIGMAALSAGKSVYNEKPLTIRREDAREMLALAKSKGLLVGGAPDTFLGAGIQTCLQLIDEGAIGEPVAATAFMMGHGHESWHPDPEFYYQVGGGPMFDMGPYYLTALVALVGPVAGVSGATRITFPTRTITSPKKYGRLIKVEVPTHVSGLLHFASGAIGTIIMSFDVWRANLPFIEIYGSDGTLSVPDPNTFGGPVRIYKPGHSDWEDVPITRPFESNSRGLGLADMARALRDGKTARAGGDLTYHVLDIMHAVHDAAEQERYVALGSTVASPEPIPETAIAQAH